MINKVKNTVPWTYVISDLNGEKIIGTFYEKELQKTNQEEFRIEKVIKKKGDNYRLNGKDMVIHLIVGLIKKDVIRNIIFARLFSVHNTISLSRHEQVCLMRLHYQRYFSHHRAT